MKTLLLLMLCITTGHLLVAQDTLTLKNGKVVGGKIISLSYGIKLLIAKDTMNYRVDEVASIMYCTENKNCPDRDRNGKSSRSDVTGGKATDNPCNCIPKQRQSTDTPLRIPTGSRSNKY